VEGGQGTFKVSEWVWVRGFLVAVGVTGEHVLAGRVVFAWFHCFFNLSIIQCCILRIAFWKLWEDGQETFQGV